MFIFYYSYDHAKKRSDIELHPTKPIIIEGDYELNGKVMVFPIVGKGKSKIILGSNKK